MKPQPKARPKEPFVDHRTASEFLGKPASWVYNRADALGIPRYKIGNVYRYSLSELAAWVREQAAGTGRSAA